MHPLPLRGEATGLEQPYLPKRGNAGPRVLRCFAHEPESQVGCSANAHLPRRDQARAALQLVECWQGSPGAKPPWLYFAAQVVPSPELSQRNHRGRGFVTIRRRGAAILRRLRALPAPPWRQAVSDPAPRRPQRLRYLEETVPLPGDQGARRPLAVTGRGREPPPWLLSNNVKERAPALIVRDAGRQRVEAGLGSSVPCFHRDGWARAGRRNVALDPPMTVLAHGC